MRYDKHIFDHKFHMGHHVWLNLSKERLQGPANKLKPIRYGPSKIMEQVSENAYRLNLSEYMNIYSFVNVEHLKLYEPSILIEDEASPNQILPSIDGLASKTMYELKEDTILEKNIHATRRGEIELWLVGLKG